MTNGGPDDPHADGRVVRAGPALADAHGALLLLHGRGAPAETLLPLGEALLQELGDDVAQLAPQATTGQWYPERFVEPRDTNEPWLSSALGWIEALLGEIADAGVPAERTAIVGFSQGACLALEVSALRGGRLGGVIALSGGLIGRELEEDRYAADLARTPFFLGCGDPDPHIPRGRVEASGALLRARGAVVDVRIYPGIGHTVNEDELQAGREILRAAMGR